MSKGGIKEGWLPGTFAAALGGGSIALGGYLANKEAGWRSTEDLINLRARQMVMGGGLNSSQVRTIDAELARRGVKNEIKLEVNIDGNGRIIAKSNDMRTSINTMKRGSFFGDMMTSH